MYIRVLISTEIDQITFTSHDPTKMSSCYLYLWLDKAALKKTENEFDAIQIQQKFCEQLLTGKDTFEALLKLRITYSVIDCNVKTELRGLVPTGTEMKYEFDQFE